MAVRLPGFRPLIWGFSKIYGQIMTCQDEIQFSSPYWVLSLKLQLIIEAPLVGELAPLAPEGFAPY